MTVATKKRITIKDVALAAKVSVGTVSKVFNPDCSSHVKILDSTKERVMQVANKMNYAPNYGATLLRNKSSKTIGFAISLPEEHNSSFLSDYSQRILDGLGVEAGKSGYDILMLWGMDYSRYMDIRRIDGLVIIGYRLNDNPSKEKMLAMFNNFTRQNYPYVIINNVYPELNAVQINVDNASGMDAVIELIQEKGYKSIGFIGEITSNPQAHHTFRCNYLKDKLPGIGLKVNEHIFINGLTPDLQEVPREGKFSHHDGFQGLQYIIDNKLDIDCLVCGNDSMALGALKCAKKNGLKVPEDIAIIGHDNINNADYFSPSLTTIEQPLEEFGKLAMQSILKKMEDLNYIEKFTIKPKLIKRESA